MDILEDPLCKNQGLELGGEKFPVSPNLPGNPAVVRYYGIPTLPAIAMFTADSKADTERPLSTPMTNENAHQTS